MAFQSSAEQITDKPAEGNRNTALSMPLSELIDFSTLKDTKPQEPQRPDSAKNILPDVTIEKPKPVIDKENGRVSKVTYPDGRTRSFGYDSTGDLNKVIQPDGAVWTRQPGKNWISNKNKEFTGSLAVRSDGTYSLVLDNGAKRVHNTDGTRSVEDPPRHAGDIAPLFDKVFQKLDLNENGYVEESELEAYTKETRRTDELDGAGEELLGVLTEHYDLLRKLSNDQTGLELGITRADMQDFSRLQAAGDQEFGALRKIGTFAEPHRYQKLDQDHNGFITTSELDSARKHALPEERKGLELIASKFDQIQKASNDENFVEKQGITNKDLDSYLRKQVGSTEYGKEMLDINWRMDYVRRHGFDAARNWSEGSWYNRDEGHAIGYGIRSVLVGGGAVAVSALKNDPRLAIATVGILCAVNAALWLKIGYDKREQRLSTQIDWLKGPEVREK